jgi:hypothetical protein
MQSLTVPEESHHCRYLFNYSNILVSWICKKDTEAEEQVQSAVMIAYVVFHYRLCCFLRVVFSFVRCREMKRKVGAHRPAGGIRFMLCRERNLTF